MSRQGVLGVIAVVGFVLGGLLIYRSISSDRPSVDSVIEEVYDNHPTEELKRLRVRMASWIDENRDDEELSEIVADRREDLEHIDQILRERGEDPDAIDPGILAQPAPERPGEG